MKRFLAGVLLSLAALFIITASLLLLTRQGLVLVIGTVDRIVPGQISIASADGGLFNHFTLHDFRYKDDSTDLLIKSISLAWRPGSLLHGEIDIRSLHVKGVSLALKETASEDNEAPLPPFRLPLAANIQKGFVDSLIVRTDEDDPGTVIQVIEVDDLHGEGESIRFENCIIGSDSYRIAAQGEIRTGDNYSARLGVSYSLNSEDLPPLTGKGRVDGPLDTLRITSQFSAPQAGMLEGTVSNLISGTLAWQGIFQADRIDLSQLDSEWPAVVLDNVRVNGEGDDMSYRLQVDSGAAYEDYKGISLSGKLEGDQNSLRFSETRIAHREESLTGAGNVSWQDTLTWQGSFHADRIAVSRLANDWPDVSLTGLQVSGEGEGESYVLRIDTEAAYATYEDILFTGIIAGDGGGLQLTDGRLSSGKAIIEGKGDFSWKDDLSWQVALTGSQFDPALIDMRWPGRIDFSAVTSGSRKDGTVKAQVDLQKLAGELRGYPVTAGGKMEVDGSSYVIDQFSLHSSDSVLSISGHLARDIDLDFALQSPGLEALWPGVAGTLQAKGKLGGTREEPVLQFDLTGRDIRAGDARVSELVATGQGVIAPDGTVETVVTASNIAAGGSMYDAAASLHGTLQEHVLDFRVNSPDFSFHSSMRGGYADSRWQGNIIKGAVHSEQLGDWNLLEPVSLALSAAAVEVGRFCLTGAQSALVCLVGGFSTEGDWRAEMDITSLPVALFPGMKEKFEEIRGTLNGTVSIQGQETEINESRLHLATDGLAMRLEAGDEFSRAIDWRLNEIEASFQDHKAAIRINSVLEDGSSVGAEVELSNLDLYPLSIGQTAVSGKIRFDILDLQPLSTVSAPYVELSGSLNGAMDITGKLLQPEFRGVAGLKQGKVIVPVLGVTVSDVGVDINGKDNVLNLGVKASSGDGTLRAEGVYTLSGENVPSLQLQVTGENFEVINQPEAKIKIAPELAITLDKDKAEVLGDIRINEAYFSASGTRGKVRPSRDIVFVDETAPDGKTDLPLYADITIFAGENANINAYGLNGRMAGQLRVIDSPGKTTIGKGILEIRDGTFSVYGRQLQIVQGRLLYSENPLEDPGIEVRAENTAGGVTTGIAVSGFLQEPDISFYSSPVMEQDEIIKRLLMNTTLVGSSEEKGFVGSVASKTGLDPLTSAVQEIKQGLHIDEVKVETGKTSEDLSLVIGTWLTPKLYVSYGKNLLAESSSFVTRYLLGHGFSLETESGATQSGVDLKYEIER